MSVPEERSTARRVAEPEPPVVHVPEQSRFQISLDGGTAVLTYVESPDEIVFDHTLTPPELRGRGLADRLARAALTWAAQTDKAVVPACWFVARWLDQHPGEIAVRRVGG